VPDVKKAFEVMSEAAHWRLLTEPGHPEVWFGNAEIVSNDQVARDTFCLRMAAAPIAGVITPGQFMMVRLPQTHDPLLGRAFALYDVVRNDKDQAIGLEIAYAAVGRMTRRLSTLRPGEKLEIWGPLGNGFPAPFADELILVAGGIGYTPFLAVAKEALGVTQYGKTARTGGRCCVVKLLFGVRSKDYVPSDIYRFSESGVQVVLSSDDGSVGKRGFVSDLLDEELSVPVRGRRVVYCCGPEPMMAKVAEICRERSVECLVSLETPMACGLGLCYSCMARIKVNAQDAGWDYRRVCVEGPVFDARRVVFEDS